MENVNWKEAPGPDEPFAGAVCFSRRMLSIRGKLSVLEITPKDEGRVTLSDLAGQELFSHPAAELRVKPALSNTFRVQRGDERWWLWGTSFQTAKQFEQTRQRIDRDDVILAVPRPAEVDETDYTRLMHNMAAQKEAWCGLWIGMLLRAGAQMG